MSAEAVAVDENPGRILLIAVHTLGNLDLQLFLAETGPPGAVDRNGGLTVKSISKYHRQAIALIIVVMYEALGLGPEANLIVDRQAERHSRRRPRQILRIGQGFRNKNVAGRVQRSTLQPQIPGRGSRLLEEAEVSSFVPVFNLAILSFLELPRELSLVRQKWTGYRLFFARPPVDLLESCAVVTRARVPRGIILARTRAILTTADMASLFSAAVH
jgi:hypothetical protein